MEAFKVKDELRELTISEKVSLTTGRDFWHTNPVPRLGIPAVRMSDGPNGVRGTRFFNGVRSACLPCATALGSTFDTNLLQEVGHLLADECRSKGAHILLGPTINIQRSPLGGRGFESFSEDPLLSGTLAGNYCKGLQERRVMAAVKHFVCNDQEHERMAVDSLVTQRALREIYLMPFMVCIGIGRPACIMTSYNKVNGTHASENQDLINILKREWRWKGLVISDWYGTYSTARGINAGQDLEMPGPTRWRGGLLENAISVKKVKSSVLDERVEAVLQIGSRAATSGIPGDAKEEELNQPHDRELLRRLVTDSVVLLKNDSSILPFDASKTVAVIGPNGKAPSYAGGGSATLNPYYTVSPFEGISNKHVNPEFSVGAQAHKFLPLLDSRFKSHGDSVGFQFQVFNKPPGDATRRLLDEQHLTSSNILLVDYKAPDFDRSDFYVDLDAIFTPDEHGRYDFGLIVQGYGQLLIDNTLLVDNTKDQKLGTAFFGHGTEEKIGSIDLEKGRPYSLKIEFSTPATQGGFSPGGLRIGCCKRIDPIAAIKDAAKLAAKVEQTAVFVGLNSDWESEDFDRPNMNLPGPHTDDLVRAVLKANPNAVIVLQSGTPVTMPWADDAKCIVQAWYGGNEAGNGLADILFGEVNPSGKLPLSFPRKLSDNPSYLNWGSERGRVLYGEDIYVGYRYYDSVCRPALFPFGHGLSYTTFEMSDLSISKGAESIDVRLTVKNTGSRDGSEVIQVYVSQESPSLRRPAKELKGFEKVRLRSGESNDQVCVKVNLRLAASFWDEERDAWIMEKGRFKVLVGNSSQGSFLEGGFEIEETSWWDGLP